jgi:hypothetical protein
MTVVRPACHQSNPNLLTGPVVSAGARHGKVRRAAKPREDPSDRAARVAHGDQAADPTIVRLYAPKRTLAYVGVGPHPRMTDPVSATAATPTHAPANRPGRGARTHRLSTQPRGPCISASTPSSAVLMPMCLAGRSPTVDPVPNPQERPMSQPTATRTSHDSRSDLAALGRATGAAGVVTVVTVIGASPVDGYQNQSMTEATPAIITFFHSVDDRMGWLMSYTTSIGLIACLWCGRARPRPASARTRRAVVLRVLRGGRRRRRRVRADRLLGRGRIPVGVARPARRQYAYDLGNLSFANSWVATGAVGICAGAIMLRAPGLPRWVACWALVAGVGEVLARAWFRHGSAYAPFALYWVWVLVTSVLLLAGRFTTGTPSNEGEMS